MIQIKDGVIEIESTNIGELLAETAAVVEAVGVEIAKTAGLSEDEIIADIFNSIKYSKLVKSGLTHDEAIEVIHGPEPETECQPDSNEG